MTYLLPSVLYLQIQHAAAFQVYNMEIKAHFPLITPMQSTINTHSEKQKPQCTVTSYITSMPSILNNLEFMLYYMRVSIAIYRHNRL